MTLKELHRIWDIELDKLNISSYPSFLPEEKDYWINASTQRFIKTRYSGLNAHRAGFQQNQKRSDDLRTVVKTVEFTATPYLWSNQYTKGDIVFIEGLYYRCIAESTSSFTLMNRDVWESISPDYNSIQLDYPSDYSIALGEYTKIATVTSTPYQPAA